MPFLFRLENWLDRFTSAIGYAAGWLFLPLIGITIFDVVTRRFFVLGSTYLQELEWHLHTALFALALGFAYVRQAHVRIDVLHAHLSPRRQAWIELLGCVLFMAPYCAVVAWYSADFAAVAFAQGEVSSSGMGLSHRWIVKSMVPIGVALLFLAGLSVFLRSLVFLFGPRELRDEVVRRQAERAAQVGT